MHFFEEGCGRKDLEYRLDFCTLHNRSVWECFQIARIEAEELAKKLEASEREVSRLTRMVELKPDVNVYGPESNRENIDRFQRLWEACVGLSDKADFKAIFRYCEELEGFLKDAKLQIQSARKRMEDLEEDAKELSGKLKGSVHEPLALGIHAVVTEALIGLGVENRVAPFPKFTREELHERESEKRVGPCAHDWEQDGDRDVCKKCGSRTNPVI